MAAIDLKLLFRRNERNRRGSGYFEFNERGQALVQTVLETDELEPQEEPHAYASIRILNQSSFR